jgi:hypothetical protein
LRILGPAPEEVGFGLGGGALVVPDGEEGGVKGGVAGGVEGGVELAGLKPDILKLSLLEPWHAKVVTIVPFPVRPAKTSRQPIPFVVVIAKEPSLSGFTFHCWVCFPEQVFWTT